MAPPHQMARHRLTHDTKTDETNFRSTRHTPTYVLTASVIIHFRYSPTRSLPSDFRMSLSSSGVNFRCLTEIAGNMSIFVSNFFSMLWSKSITGRLEFSGTSKIKSTFWRNPPWSRMIAFQKYRSNPCRIVPGDTVPNTEAVNAARIETGAASATRCSTISNVNRAKTQA